MKRFIKLGGAVAGATLLALAAGGVQAQNGPGITDKEVLN